MSTDNNNTTDRKKYKVSRSDYSVKKIHKKVDKETTIYDRDYMVLNGVGVWKEDELHDGVTSFKIVREEGSETSKKYNSGGWTEMTGGVSDDDSSKSENEVVIRTTYPSITNFAYFGSAKDLVDSTIKRGATFKDDDNAFCKFIREQGNNVVLNYYVDDERGVRYYPKSIQVQTGSETSEDLQTICNFCDDRYTDNLYRAMTHDAIKNMDNTLVHNNEDINDYLLGHTKISELIRCIGRQLDKIKLYADNIKYINNLSYGDINSMPNYLLTDKLELMGWEIYPSYENSDDHIKFLKRLLLNSRAILSRKGTRYGVEMLLKLFDFSSYQITEYVYNATGEIKYDDVIKYNRWKLSYDQELGDNNYEEDPLSGLPLGVDENGNIVPWFDRTLKMDGDPYFHMSGSWPEKSVNNIIVVPKITDIPNIDKKYCVNGAICYVDDITNAEEYYNNPSDYAKPGYYNYQLKDGSHYFMLLDNEYYFCVGEFEGGKYGWVSIEEDSTEVKNAESVVDNNKGNNPHNGYGYDGGDGYKELFQQVFKMTIDKDSPYNRQFIDAAYECGGGLITGITECGFAIDEISNDKVTYGGNNMLLNSKKIDIQIGILNKKRFNTYIKPYLLQIIPSTAILTFSFA